MVSSLYWIFVFLTLKEKGKKNIVCLFRFYTENVITKKEKDGTYTHRLCTFCLRHCRYPFENFGRLYGTCLAVTEVVSSLQYSLVTGTQLRVDNAVSMKQIVICYKHDRHY